MTKELTLSSDYVIETFGGNEQINITSEQRDKVWDLLRADNDVSHFKVGDIILHRSEIRKIIPHSRAVTYRGKKYIMPDNYNGSREDYLNLLKVAYN